MREETSRTRRQGASRGAVWLNVGAWSLVMILGCAGPPLMDRATGVPAQSEAEASVRRVTVPFFPDDTDQCGPAVLASVLTYWGVRTDPVALKEEIYLPRLKGTLPLDLMLAAQARGLKAEIYEGGLDDLKSELEAGRPLVALLDLGFAIFPQGHYVVVTGYDDRRQGVYVHSSLEKDVFIPYERFLRSWDRTGRWTLLVTPPESRLRSHA
jgi:ABC-type bacteriocin/lantibiotic exporter with double-glycine peptidase domain